MEAIVKVTRRGQTTIPMEFRLKYDIHEGDHLRVESSAEGLLLTVIPRLEKLAGAYSKYGRIQELKQELEKMREEY